MLDQILEPGDSWLKKLDPYKRYLCLMQYEHPETASEILRLDMSSITQEIREDLSTSFPSLF